MKKLILSLFMAISFISFSCSDTPDEKLMKARVEISNKNYEHAISMIKQILKDDPKFVEAYYYKGIAEQGANKIDSAVASFTKSITLNKNFVGAYIERAKIELAQKKYDFAISDYSTAITLFPKESEWIFQRGMIYYNSGQEDEACFDFKSASELGHIEAGRFHQKFCQNKSTDSLAN